MPGENTVKRQRYQRAHPTTPHPGEPRSQTTLLAQQVVTAPYLGPHATGLAGQRPASPTATGNFTAPHPDSSAAPQEPPENPYNLPPDLLAIKKNTPLSPELIERLLRHSFKNTPPNDSVRAHEYLEKVTHRKLNPAYIMSSLYLTYGDELSTKAKNEISPETQTWMERVRTILVENENPMTARQILEKLEEKGYPQDPWNLYLTLQAMEAASLIDGKRIFTGNTDISEFTLTPNGASCPIPTHKPDTDCIIVTRAIYQYKTHNGEKRPTHEDIQRMISRELTPSMFRQCIRAVYGYETLAPISVGDRQANVEVRETSQNPPPASANTDQSSGAPPSSVKRMRHQNTQHRPQGHQSFAAEAGPTVTPGAIPATSSNIPDDLPIFLNDPFPDISIQFIGSSNVNDAPRN